MDVVPPDWKDKAAAELYGIAGGPQLAGAHARLANALKKQAAKAEEHFNTPYTKDAADVLEASTRALVIIGDELRKWHELVYPARPTRKEIA